MSASLRKRRGVHSDGAQDLVAPDAADTDKSNNNNNNNNAAISSSSISNSSSIERPASPPLQFMPTPTPLSSSPRTTGGRRSLSHRDTQSSAATTSSTSSSNASAGGDAAARKAAAMQQALSNPLAWNCHKPTSSLLSSASRFNNYRGLFNLCMLILVLSNLRMIVENVAKYGVLVNPLRWFSWWIEDPYTWPNLLLALSLNIYIFAALHIERRLADGRLSNNRGRLFHCINIFLELVIPLVIVFVAHPNPAGSVLVIGQASVIWLKLVSWVMFNGWCREERAAALTGTRPPVTIEERQQELERLSTKYEQELREQQRRRRHHGHGQDAQPAADASRLTNSVNALKDEVDRWTASDIDFVYDPPLLYPNNLTASNLYYFMLAPTLCYELNFPRTRRIRWRFLARRIVETVFFAVLLFALGEQWVVPTVKNSMKPLHELDWTTMTERVLKLAIPNHFLWLIFFYWFFHCVLNAMAEVLRFADREFYRDWWNATTIQYFWRNWNIPVHKWCARHFYLPLMRAGYSRPFGWLAVFLLSALFHEILVSVPLGMFKIWAFAAMMGQIPLAVITERFFKNSQYGNVVVWFSLVLGQPIAVLMYVYDYLVIHQKL
ncbi:acyl-CoA:1,2-diacylglycerol O-transferase [Capsaspora owczarzaki ATCC 30864]|uniref:acyl-CoA:1,2-diacylglycerol O-transferase n=1 Tax=Capsaspora owczarzaki (strain ATCC 30864) TaxID=595528 RepID=UPI0003521765|nr:acyl-CoA:1,2-diacylglycerol O-transferase [Capsaspora owczarzaki ATCC 30864]|eukprot:XP_004345614.2 acyl-CoA:1,2-diacylglycerol O-transferase [Capsaspora owczarzaki ATCC 30864]